MTLHQFLKKKGKEKGMNLTARFKNRVRTCSADGSAKPEEVLRRNLLKAAFVWGYSKEGFKFWSDLYEEFSDIND